MSFCIVLSTYYLSKTSPYVTSESQLVAREDSGVLASDGFEGKQIATFWHAELRTPTAGLLTSDVHRAGKQAMRFAWKPSQYDGTNSTLHAELLTSPLPIGETERWYGYSSYMPSSSMENDSQTVIISQWHGFPDEGGAHTVPAMAISVEPANTLQLVYRASNKPITTFLQHPTSQKVLNLGKARFDQWVDYVVHVNWDPMGTTGQLQLWQNGILIVNETGITIGYSEQHKPYWKCGLYCWTGKSKYVEKVIYYDEVRIGGHSASYDTVRPGLSDGTARMHE
ncbi:polysaccharide lyase [Spirosoma jeollabukense]